MNDLDEKLLREWVPVSEIKTRVLYHYTSAAGVLGILSSGHLLGSNAGFLNDSTEIAFGLAVCSDVLREQRGRRGNDEQRLLDRVLGFISDEEPPSEVYVTSFTTQRDVLSQWRGYTSNSGRYCLVLLCHIAERL